MNDGGKSDKPIVPRKRPNKDVGGTHVGGGGGGKG